MPIIRRMSKYILVYLYSAVIIHELDLHVSQRHLGNVTLSEKVKYHNSLLYL